MFVRSSLAGMIEMDKPIGDTFFSGSRPALCRLSRFREQDEFDGHESSMLVTVALSRLHDELDVEYRRLLARLAA